MQLPSPIHQVTFRNHTVFVKRDDLIDPFISGNKWRKLKHTLAKATSLGKTHLITFGGAYSNHLLATAAAGAKLGFKTTAFVRGEEVSNEILMLCKIFGMHLIFVDRDSYKNKAFLFEILFGDDQKAYFIDEGGSSYEGTLGCAEIITELKQDHFDHIFCAAGTGTTAAGILSGIVEQKVKSLLHVVPVLKGGSFIADEILKYQPDLSKLSLHLDYHFGGYAKTNPNLLQFIKDFSSETGMLIDPVYTGKLFYAIFDLLEKGIIDKQEKILAIHTGGLFGLFGMQEKFNALLK